MFIFFNKWERIDREEYGEGVLILKMFLLVKWEEFV